AGSVAWQFEQKGVITVNGGNFDDIFMTAAEVGADDVQDDGEGAFTVTTPREQLAAVEQALTNAGYTVEDSELKWMAKNETQVATDKAMANLRLMSDLEELDDVQAVASNLMITDEAIEAFETA
ncbi:MAG: YebC/PmpR family DNA-binding transcriptional regulator, partial [Blastochloris sp.]|nr:YebC/PmpR family DNA-binding transcriptional regulator [Blastochloris sp.]